MSSLSAPWSETTIAWLKANGYGHYLSGTPASKPFAKRLAGALRMMGYSSNSGESRKDYEVRMERYGELWSEQDHKRLRGFLEQKKLEDESKGKTAKAAAKVTPLEDDESLENLTMEGSDETVEVRENGRENPQKPFPGRPARDASLEEVLAEATRFDDERAGSW